ncbi:hypothetical protein VTN02DRAFT_1019 [Thermoascus thermophilus]
MSVLRLLPHPPPRQHHVPRVRRVAQALGRSDGSATMESVSSVYIDLGEAVAKKGALAVGTEQRGAVTALTGASQTGPARDCESFKLVSTTADSSGSDTNHQARGPALHPSHDDPRLLCLLRPFGVPSVLFSVLYNIYCPFRS